MKAYRMKIKGSGKDVGYRLVSDKGNCYDVIKDNVPFSTETSGTVYGKLQDGEFRVGNKGTIVEVHKGSFILDIASIMLNNDEKRKYGYTGRVR